MAVVRRGRKPKVAENEEMLNFDQVNSEDESAAGARETENGAGETEAFDEDTG
jgi:hypothetical protein